MAFVNSDAMPQQEDVPASNEHDCSHSLAELRLSVPWVQHMATGHPPTTRQTGVHALPHRFVALMHTSTTADRQLLPDGVSALRLRRNDIAVASRAGKQRERNESEHASTYQHRLQQTAINLPQPRKDPDHTHHPTQQQHCDMRRGIENKCASTGPLHPRNAHVVHHTSVLTTTTAAVASRPQTDACTRRLFGTHDGGRTTVAPA